MLFRKSPLTSMTWLVTLHQIHQSNPKYLIIQGLVESRFTFSDRSFQNDKLGLRPSFLFESPIQPHSTNSNPAHCSFDLGAQLELDLVIRGLGRHFCLESWWVEVGMHVQPVPIALGQWLDSQHPTVLYLKRFSPLRPSEIKHSPIKLDLYYQKVAFIFQRSFCFIFCFTQKKKGQSFFFPSLIACVVLSIVFSQHLS